MTEVVGPDHPMLLLLPGQSAVVLLLLAGKVAPLIAAALRHIGTPAGHFLFLEVFKYRYIQIGECLVPSESLAQDGSQGPEQKLC